MLTSAASILIVTALTLALAPACEWRLSNNTDRQCVSQKLCTASNLTWSVPTTYSSAAGCALLQRKGLRTLFLRSDSFQRHLSVGLVLTLTGKYRNGALYEGMENCDYKKQLTTDAAACCWTLTSLSVAARPCCIIPRPTPRSATSAMRRSLAASPCGASANHPLDKDYHQDHPGWRTVNSVPDHVAFLEQGDVCPFAAQHHAQCRVWWVTTHQQLRNDEYFGLMDHDTVRRYNMGMRDFFEAGKCGRAHVVDVFNMTHALATELTREAGPLTYDRVHWADVVNLIKAQIVLNDIEAHLPDVEKAARPRRMLPRLELTNVQSSS